MFEIVWPLVNTFDLVMRHGQSAATTGALPGLHEASIRVAILVASPITLNLGILVPTRPTTTGPVWMPTRTTVAPPVWGMETVLTQRSMACSYRYVSVVTEWLKME